MILRWVWWHVPLMPAFGRRRVVDLCGFEVTLIYILSSIQASQGYRVRPCFKKKKKKTEMLATNRIA